MCFTKNPIEMNTSKSLSIILAILSLAATSLRCGAEELRCAAQEETKWANYPARQYTYNKEFIDHILSFTLIQSEEVALNFETDEEKALLWTDFPDFNKAKQAALEKFSIRMLLLQCNTALMFYQRLTTLETSGEEPKFSVTNDEIRRMLSMFYEAKSVVHNSFWLIHTGILAHASSTENMNSGSFKHNVTNKVNNLQQFIQECKSNKLLPPDTSFNSVQKTYENYSFIMESKPKQFYKYEDLFTEWNYRCFIAVNNIEKFYQPIGGVNWTTTTKMVKQNIKACQEVRHWYSEPFKNVDNQTAIVQLVEAVVLYRVLIHIMCYSTFLSQINGDDDESAVQTESSEFWILFERPMRLAIDILDVNNGVLWDVRYHIVVTKSIDRGTLASLRTLVLNTLKSVLRQLWVPDVDMALTNIDDIGPPDEITVKAKENAKELEKYFIKVAEVFRQSRITISFIRFFLDGRKFFKNDGPVLKNDNNTE